MKLLEVGQQFPIRCEIRKRGYVQVFKLPRRKIKISLRRFRKLIRKLQRAYPDKGYRLTQYRGYIVLRRGKYSITNPPIYYDPKKGKFYIPATYAKRKPELCSTVIRMRLKELGIPLKLKTLPLGGEKRG